MKLGGRWPYAVVVVLLACAAGLVVRHLRRAEIESQDFPEGIPWLCTAPQCSAEFSVTLADMSVFYREHPEENLPCPRCGGRDTVRAVRCEQCGWHYPRAQAVRGQASRCPACAAQSRP